MRPACEEPKVDDHEGAIQQGLEDAEAAIESHPPPVVEVYRAGKEAFLGGIDRGGGTDPVSLLAIRYLLAMAFISGWYHVHGDKVNRNKAAQSAATAIGLVGMDPMHAFQQVLDFEQLWRQGFRAAGIGRRPSAGRIALGMLILAALIALAVMLLER